MAFGFIFIFTLFSKIETTVFLSPFRGGGVFLAKQLLSSSYIGEAHFAVRSREF